MEKARCNTELYSNLRRPLNNVKPSNFWGSHQWNFALLNASTNKSYGNDIYPLKRKRIMTDEESVYTPICTRAMFEKAYSHKLNNLMAWTRTDAYDFWNYMCDTLKDFLQKDFNLPFNY